jgi:hypothetical protein
VRLTTFPNAELIALTQAYRAAHPELLEQAAERVRRDPTLRATAQREERERQRHWRKAQRSGVVDRAVT